MKKYGGYILKLGFILLIFAYLFYRSCQNDSISRFLSADKNWGLIGLGVLLNLIGVLITFIRWRWLNNALGVRLSVNGTIRLGFIGFLFNFLPMGIVGGDLVKGVLLAKKNSDHKAACAVSIIMDRVLGLYIMFIMGALAIYGTGFYRNPQKESILAVQTIYWLTGISTVGLAFFLFPGSTHDWRGQFFQKIPLVGKVFGQLYEATAHYQRRPGVLFISCLVTFGVHFFLAMSLYCFALGLWGFAPSAANHFVIYPVANMGTMIPLSAGPMEYFLDVLYPLFEIPNHIPYETGYGMMVGIAYRLATVLIAGIGGIYYLLSRGEIGEALQEIDREKKSKEGMDARLEELQERR